MRNAINATPYFMGATEILQNIYLSTYYESLRIYVIKLSTV